MLTETERMLIDHFKKDHSEELRKTVIEEIEAGFEDMKNDRRPHARDHLLRAERILNSCAGSLEAIRYVVEFPENVDFLKQMGLIPEKS